MRDPTGPVSKFFLAGLVGWGQRARPSAGGLTAIQQVYFYTERVSQLMPSCTRVTGLITGKSRAEETNGNVDKLCYSHIFGMMTGHHAELHAASTK